MDLTTDTILIGGSFLLFISIVTSKISNILGIPTLLVFLLIGMVVGSGVLGNATFHNPYAAKVLGATTLSLILFAGGIETEYKQIRPILGSGMLLATIGILITTFSMGYFVYLISNFSFLEGLLIGSIISSTDAAAVFSIIRSNNMHLKANLAPLLELESGSNDTMAYFLMTFFLKLITHSNQKMSLWSFIPQFIEEMVIGGATGFFVGKVMLFILSKIQLNNKSLYPGLTLAIILFTYSTSHLIHGNGFLAVYMAGLVLGNSHFVHKESITHFCDGLAWIMQIIMFITLGLLVSVRELIPIAGIGILFSSFLMFIARPMSVFIALFFSKFNIKHKVLISWVGLRGAVPIVFATYPMMEGIEKATTIYHIIFFVVFTSILLQGTTLSTLARWLQLEDLAPVTKSHTIKLPEDIKNELVEIVVSPESPVVGKKLVQLSFPENALILLIKREKRYLTPRGDTTINASDTLMIMLENDDAIQHVKSCLGIS